MIVPSMSHPELIKELRIDLIAVERKAGFLADSLRREVYKTRTKPLDKWFDYKSARNNNWLLMISHHGKYHYLYPFAWFITEHGINIVSPWQPAGKKMEFYHYTSHFIKRYNERFLKDPKLPVLETFKRFLVSNMDLNAQSKTPGTYESDIMGIVNQGVIFGTAQYHGYDLYITYKTYISNEMILKFQESTLRDIDDFKNGKIFNINEKLKNYY